ncbi:MAG: hypothetical protein IJW00_02655 [Clostridia bacterium]|nr:hypothetical protein [Clostridia bacterium]
MTQKRRPTAHLFLYEQKGVYRPYSILIGVLVITGVTTSVICHAQITKLNAYMVSEDDYTIVVPNLRVVAGIGESETVSHGWDHIAYAAIDGVDYHEFLYAEQHEGMLWGGVTHDHIILCQRQYRRSCGKCVHQGNHPDEKKRRDRDPCPLEKKQATDLLHSLKGENMKKQERLQKLLTYAVCMAIVILGAAVLMLIFHCPLGIKAIIWVGMAALSLLLLWPLKRYVRTVSILTAVFLSVTLLCCTYVEPYFIKEAQASAGSPLAKDNVWLAAWVLLAVGLFYRMTHVVTRMMDRLSPNEEIFDEDTLPAQAASPQSRVVLSAVLSVAVVVVGIFSGIAYHKNVAAIPDKAPHSEADYTVVMPNFKSELSDDASNVVTYGADWQAAYLALEHIPTNEFIHVAQSVNGTSLNSLILRHKDHTLDPARTADVLSATYLFGTTSKVISGDDREFIISILRGDCETPPVTVTDPQSHGAVKVLFHGIDHLWWEADVMEKNGTYYLRVATNTDFSAKDQRYDPQYVFYPLPKQP